VGCPTTLVTKKEGRFYRVVSYGPIEIPSEDEWREEETREEAWDDAREEDEWIPF
jgi:hypothetical protein